MSQTSLCNNSLAFIARANEYCSAAEHARETDRQEFIATMVRLLPRLYITASDLKPDGVAIEEDAYLEQTLDEDYYESIRRKIEYLMGPDDTYLEVFEEDMKYSDTPIAASIAEGLADIFQVLYNFVEMIRDTPPSVTEGAIIAVREDFDSYWSRILCNVMRPLNAIFRSTEEPPY